MMDTGTLKQILLEEMNQYTSKGLNDDAYLTRNDTEQFYTVVAIATIRDKCIVSTVLVARIVGQQIIIEVDRHDKELVDALRARNVPQSQLILAYRGDAVPA